MWVFFGIGSLMVMLAIQIYRRLFYVWDGKFSYSTDIKYEYFIKMMRRKYLKDKPLELFIGIECNVGNDFHLKYEGYWDKVFKYLMLVNEHQINHKRFDDTIYVVSDNEQLKSFLSNNQQIAEQILSLFKDYEQFKLGTIKEFRLFRNKLWIKFSTMSEFKDELVKDIANDVVPILNTIKEIFKEGNLPKNSIKNDPFLLKSIILLSISSGLLFTGLIYFFRVVNTPFPFNIDSLLSDSISFGLALVFLLMVVTIFLLKKSSRTHLVLFELLFIGSIGAIGTSYMLYSDINMSLDTSKPTIYKVNVLDKEISRGQKSTSYYIYLPQWYGNRRIREKIKVSSNTYYAFKKNEIVRIIQREGFFHKRWVETIEKESW